MKRKSQPEPRPDETIYRTAVLEAIALPDGKVGFIAHTAGHIHVFPMPPEYAERLAGDITAKAIAVQTKEPT